MAYTFDPVFAVDPNNPANVAKGASITIFDPADPAQSPIAITDPTGSPLPNPITVDAAGMGPAYQHPTLARVGWKGAGFVGYFTSYEGMLNETKAAKEAAQAAASTAATEATSVLEARIAAGEFKGEAGKDGANVLPTDTAIQQAITDTTSAARAALTSVIGEQVAPKLDKATAAATYAQPDLLSFVTLGDSRTAYNGGVTVANPGETAVYKADRGYVSWAMVLLRQRMKWLKNGGVGGDTVAQMLARTDALLALNPGWLIGFGHINSVSANVSSASIITDLTTIFDKAAAKGIRVVWGTDWVDSTKTTAQRAVAYAVNEWLRNQVGTRRGFYLADYQAVFVDPGTGNPIAANASDGLHQDGIGPRVLADQLVKVLEPLVPQQDRLIASNDDKTNLLPNGMMTGNSAGGYATGWGYNGTASQGVQSKVPRTDGFPGEWQQIAVTGGTDYSLRNRIAANVADSWRVGDTVYAECEFETDAAGWAATEFNLNLVLFNVPAGSVTRSADMIHLNGTPASTGRPARGIFRTPPLTIPAGNTHLELHVALKGSGTYRIARAAIKRV